MAFVKAFLKPIHLPNLSKVTAIFFKIDSFFCRKKTSILSQPDKSISYLPFSLLKSEAITYLIVALCVALQQNELDIKDVLRSIYAFNSKLAAAFSYAFSGIQYRH